MKARVKAKNCKIKVTTYFNEYYLNFNADDVLEIEVDEKVTDFILLVKRMREAQKRAEMITGEEDMNFIDMLFVERREAEREVDEYLKKMEDGE